MYARRIGQPVVGVDYIAVNSACNNSRHYRIIVDFLKQVIGITPRKLYAAEVIGAHVVEIGIDFVAQTEIQVGIHHLPYPALNIIAADVAPCHRHLRCADDVGKLPVFIAEWLGYDKGYVHISALPHAFCQAIAGGS